MFSTKSVFFLVLLPVVAYCYKCAVSDSATDNGVSDCSSSNFCVTMEEYNANGDWVKEVRQCDHINCRSNGKRSVYNPAGLTTTTYDCCTGDYCNSATSKGLIALPVLILSYVLFK
ncbi:Protein CBG14832 [Caenorhabditis briggsae]|uniref:Protein CBG14832 n=2 Tax=Caenorhabditis briggsae TaxID=6238 RepID=A8XKS9_CAEBR|nr:Protein CBG14832 [Caenorhabditis briggsae]ULT82637.1 hypothetical protein L3Y34_012110 [Caenorhabditis briggsae]CAP33253.1 Protein CBG14832 [Caenorhabditis briggsae]